MAILHKDKIEKICLHPLFIVITTIMGVLAGIFGAKDGVFPPCFLISDNCNLLFEATFFWLMLSAFGIFFGGTFWAQDRNSTRVASTFHTKANEIDSLIRQLHTLPPAGFLVKYTDSILK